MENVIEKQIQFRYSNIVVLFKNVNQMPDSFAGADFKTLSYNFNIKIEVAVKPELNTVIFNVNVSINEQNKSDILANFSIANLFEIVNFNDFIKLNNNGLYDIPPGLDSLLKPICLSTARGIIYTNLLGTYLQNTIMPVVFMNTFETLPPKVNI